MGREFLDIFEEWANDYDQSVAGSDPEYAAVFHNYEGILDEVTSHAVGNVLEFGVGTGNLTNKLMEKGHRVIGIEPSQAMRVIAKKKFPQLEVLDGDFLNFPEVSIPIHTIASTYAFHHLTDDEKEIAIARAKKVLTDNGRIIIGDTMFPSEAEKLKTIRDAEKKGLDKLVEDLNREYYPTISVIANMLEKHDFHITFKQMNHFVWIAIAERKRV